MACCAPNEMTIGLGVILWSVILGGIGVLFSFNKVILAVGNILLLPGLVLTFGLKSMLRFFRQNFKGSICFALGFFYVMIGSPIIGIMFESCGVIVLLCECCRTPIVSLWRLPVAGQTFDESSRLWQVPFRLGFCFYLVSLFSLVILAIIIEVKLQAIIFSSKGDVCWEKDICQLA